MFHWKNFFYFKKSSGEAIECRCRQRLLCRDEPTPQLEFKLAIAKQPALPSKFKLATDKTNLEKWRFDYLEIEHRLSTSRLSIINSWLSISDLHQFSILDCRLSILDCRCQIWWWNNNLMMESFVIVKGEWIPDTRPPWSSSRRRVRSLVALLQQGLPSRWCRWSADSRYRQSALRWAGQSLIEYLRSLPIGCLDLEVVQLDDEARSGPNGTLTIVN